MFIVHKGLVAVVGGASDNEVLAELRPGSIFGEIRWIFNNAPTKHTYTTMHAPTYLCTGTRSMHRHG